MIVRLPAPSQAGAVARRNYLIATPLLHLHAIAALRRRQNRLAVLPLAITEHFTEQYMLVATPLSIVELAKFPDPHYSTSSGSPNTATLWGRGR